MSVWKSVGSWGRCVAEGMCVWVAVCVWVRRARETGTQPASTNAAAGLKEPEARLYECIKWMLIGSPRFLPLVELLLLSSLPLMLLPLLPVFKNKCHIPPISYLLCWQPQWPVEDSLPQQPVHSRRRPVYTVLIGSAPRCPPDLSFPLAPSLFSSPLLSFLHSYFATGPFRFTPPSSVVSAPAQLRPPYNVQWFAGAPAMGYEGRRCFAEAWAAMM